MSGIEVDPAELRADDAELREACEQCRSALARVQASARGLRWVGCAGSAFRLGYEQWLDGAHSMLDSLDALAGLIAASAAGYAATEEAVRAGLARAAS